MKPSNQKVYGLVGLMTFFWSLNYIVVKVALRSFPPLLIGPLRAVVAALILLPIYLWMGRRTDRWRPREVLTLAGLGVFGITLNQVFFVLGMERTSVAHAALVIATTPLQVMLLAALRGQESITVRKVAGMGVAIAGIAVLHLGPSKSALGTSLWGDSIVFLASFCFSLYTVFGKEATESHDSLTVNSLGYFAGALAGAPLLAQQSAGFHYEQVSASGWWALAYMALISSVFCYLAFQYALNHLPASRVAAFSYVQPVIAALAGLFMLREPITGAVAAGGLLVLSGVWVTGRS